MDKKYILIAYMDVGDAEGYSQCLMRLLNDCVMEDGLITEGRVLGEEEVYYTFIQGTMAAIHKGDLYGGLYDDLYFLEGQYDSDVINCLSSKIKGYYD